MEKLVIKSKKSDDKVKFKPIQLYEETHDIITAVSEATGESKAATVHKLIAFAYEYLEIEE